MTSSDVYAALNQIFNDVFSRSDIALRPEYSSKDVEGWDSFKQIEIIMAVEERLGVKLSAREIDRLRTVGDLASAIVSRTSGRTGS